MYVNQSNLFLAHNIKISDICRKIMFEHLVPHDHKERMLRQLGQLVKTRLGARVHRQTLPALAQTWAAIFFLGMTACYENVEMNITPFREWDFSPPKQHICFTTQRAQTYWFTLCSVLFCAYLCQAWMCYIQLTTRYAQESHCDYVFLKTRSKIGQIWTIQVLTLSFLSSM